jgi:hypothetical protein
MGVVIDVAAKGYPNTSLRWMVASLAVVLGLSIAIVAFRQHQITGYEAGYAAATQRIDAVVTTSTDRRRFTDFVTVQWRGIDGAVRQRTFDVSNAADHPVGSALRLRVASSSPDEVYPDSRVGIDETAPWRWTIGLLIPAMIIAILLYGYLAVRWWRAARGPVRRHRAHVWYSYGRWEMLGIPWLTIVDGQETYHQRLMWEPWVPGINDELVVEARRVGRGPFVVDVPGYGRLWPAGRARRRQPRAEKLVSRRTSRFRLSRVSTVGALTIFMVQSVPLVGWIGWIATVGYMWLLTLYFGGPAAPAPWLMPKEYPRIKGLRSFSPTDAPGTPLPKPRGPRGSPRRARRAGPGSR